MFWLEGSKIKKGHDKLTNLPNAIKLLINDTFVMVQELCTLLKCTAPLQVLATHPTVWRILIHYASISGKTCSVFVT